MKKFDDSYVLLEDMFNDEYFPDFLVEKIKALICNVISLLEEGERYEEVIQNALDEMTNSINDLQEEFDENDSEIETVARDSIAESVDYVLNWFGVEIDIEDALGERDW